MHHVIRLKVYYIDMNYIYIYIFAQFKKKYYIDVIDLVSESQIM